VSAKLVHAVGDNRVGRYDFGRTEVIDRARIRRLQPVFDSMVHRVGGSLTASLRQAVQLEVTGLEQMAWETYAGSLPDPTFLASALILPLEGRFVMHLPVKLVLHLLDVYLGGDGTEEPDRPTLTEIETHLIGNIADELFQAIPAAFHTFVELGLGVVQKFSSAIYVQTSRPEETCLVVELAISVAENTPQTFHLSIPMTALLPIVEAFERLQRVGGPDEPAVSDAGRNRLRDVPVEVQVAYPPISLTTNELLGLRVGDVVPLGHDSGADTQFDVLAEGIPFARGVLVEKGRRLACTVTGQKVNGR
jgi:flagellar motor switch protein FliM